MITLQRASRWYGQVIGLNDVTCTIPPGITAILGPNGAGKSTMIKLVTGQLRPSTGRVTVFNEAPFANPRVFRRLGYCPESESSYDEMSGREMVTMLGAMAGISGAALGARVGEVLEQVGMTAAADRPIGGYSKGMRQRIKLAQGMVHDPDVLLLDEPLNGLDPVGRRHVSDLLREFASRGKCVVVASHILHEVEQLTHNILLVNKGRLLAQGDVYRIRGFIDNHPHHIVIQTDEGRRLAKRLLDLPSVQAVRVRNQESTRVEVETQSPEEFYNSFPDLVLADGFRITSFDSPDNNLEAVFRYLVKE